MLRSLALWFIRICAIAAACQQAYSIRLYAVKNFGRVIHEFDPWFNYRAAEYLAEHGTERFFKWFDHSVWYPLGRPVGTSIYPGMQFIAVAIWRLLSWASPGVESMSLHDVCVFTPAWFGVLTTAMLGLFTAEVAESLDAGIAAACLYAILPAHIMRSVAGGFDNECVAMAFFCGTFFCWCRSLRSSWPLLWGILSGIVYFGMVASWGGYVYVINIISLHAGALCVTGHFTSELHRAFSSFYVVGTALATQIPVVGSTPLRSLEQMGPLAVFALLQVLEVSGRLACWRGLSLDAARRFQLKAVAVAAGLAAAVSLQLLHAGYFAPVSARVRGLFIRHTKTGNPLVDSVAEHQATSSRAYRQYFHYTCQLSLIGLVMCCRPSKMTAGKKFLLLYAWVTYYFSTKMNRLILLLGPAAGSLSGIALAGGFRVAFRELEAFARWLYDGCPEEGEQQATKKADGGQTTAPGGPGSAEPPSAAAKTAGGELSAACSELLEPMLILWRELPLLRRTSASLFLLSSLWYGSGYFKYCHLIAEAMSDPDIIVRKKLPNGTFMLLDDYRESYWWLRDHTPQDARVMAWWDYGYQINGLANRTTLADGNTWNHEHIALLGRCLTSAEAEAHEIIRHLADYVLIWAGGGGDDLAKSPHMMRIANSVYNDLCPGDPKCSAFGFGRDGKPTAMMSQSLLYKLAEHNTGDVHVNASLFREAYTSQHGLVRIFEVLNVCPVSKAWTLNPRNRRCDAEGSWYCPGSYPPALHSFFDKRQAFRQLEDFNAAAHLEATAGGGGAATAAQRQQAKGGVEEL
eukprot:TRINITY_DN10805_c0_g1_i1.p1 TRINITY_DN10805_c0_g1~~TRINITY_DN10805_c0_g1_i1.p1  ORF type:complete len:801 (-),score=145.24 TRINITY_DN10805_c0_g1_i1:50-2452(-)